MAERYTFGFVDLAGFTALTEVHGDQVAADQIHRMTGLAQEAMTGSTVVVKVVGDAVLLVDDDVEGALRSTHALLSACNSEPEFPLARGGLHTGSAVRRGDDYVGSGVNVAARVTARAAGGELLLTSEPAAAARRLGLPVHDIGAVELRNVAGPVELFKVELEGGGTAVDPVCRMTVERTAAAGVLVHDAREYWFCSLKCAAAFAQNPEPHLSPAVES